MEDFNPPLFSTKIYINQLINKKDAMDNMCVSSGKGIYCIHVKYDNTEMLVSTEI